MELALVGRGLFVPERGGGFFVRGDGSRLLRRELGQDVFRDGRQGRTRVREGLDVGEAQGRGEGGVGGFLLGSRRGGRGRGAVLSLARLFARRFFLLFFLFEDSQAPLGVQKQVDDLLGADLGLL